MPDSRSTSSRSSKVVVTSSGRWNGEKAKAHGPESHSTQILGTGTTRSYLH